jgi:hypothetical protein
MEFRLHTMGLVRKLESFTWKQRLFDKAPFQLGISQASRRLCRELRSGTCADMEFSCLHGDGRIFLIISQKGHVSHIADGYDILVGFLNSKHGVPPCYIPVVCSSRESRSFWMAIISCC